MRLQAAHVHQLKVLAAEEAGPGARLRLFGSRVDDAARGGDVDLMVEIPSAVADPALLAARIAARASRLMNGRKVDAILAAPNLAHLPIHDAARRLGIEL